MLTMRPPIRLQFQKPLDTVHRDMEEKIRGNYSLLNERIRKEELLHVTASSPEVYFEQGGVTNILNETTSQNRQELHLEVINNLINRILVSNTDNFTYQDSVYISNVLRKIGITDVNRFMKQISNLQTERRDNYKLIRLYEENKQYLTKIMEQETVMNRETKVNDGEKSVQKEEYYLHDQIYNRLNTDKVYQDIRNFVQGNSFFENRVTAPEMRVAEQAALTQSFQLHSLRNEVLHTDAPLYYYHTNTYETAAEDAETEEKVTSEITSAVLMNLLDQVYFLKQDMIEQKNHTWYSVANALFNTAENTWKRYEWNHLEGSYDYRVLNQNTEYLNEKKQEEIRVLTEIENQYKSWNQQWNQTKTEYDSSYITQNLFHTEKEEYTNQTEVYPEANKELELQYLVSQINNENRENTKELTVEEIKEQIRITEERNLENLRKIKELQERERLQPKLVDIKVDKKLARQHGLEALESPEKVLREILQSETGKQIVTENTEEVIRKQNYYEKEIQEQIRYNIQENQLIHPETEYTNEEIIKESVTSKNVLESDIQAIRFLQENRQIVRNIRNLESIVDRQRTERVLHQIRNLDTRQVSLFFREDNQSITEEMLNSFHHRLQQTITEQGQENRIVKETEWKELILNQPLPASHHEFFRNVSLLHKEEEQVITEELLNTIRFQTQQTVREQTVENKTVKENRVIETNLQQTTQQITAQQFANMEDIVQQNVKKQIGQLSDQIYGKLEKKLQTERKRRGY